MTTTCDHAAEYLTETDRRNADTLRAIAAKSAAAQPVKPASDLTSPHPDDGTGRWVPFNADLAAAAVKHMAKSAKPAKRNVCRWVARPTPIEGGWHKAILEINGTLYGASAFHAVDDDSGLSWLCVDMRKPCGKHYRLTFNPNDGGASCDCEDAVYREHECKHIAAVRAAMLWLEERERLDWELHVAQAAANEYATEAAF